jgi:hypothetical protein
VPKRAHKSLSLAVLALACASILPATAFGETSGTTGPTGTTAPSSPTPTSGGVSPSDPAFQPAPKGKIVDGIAIPPIGAPPEVVAAIDAANAIVRKPYIYGGGHRSFNARGYDCSGAVSFALHGAGLLDSPLDSSDFLTWGDPGRGKWITVYTNPGHAFVMIAGLRFDTGFRDRIAKAQGAAPGTGPRWGGPRPTRGYHARHPVGF